MARPEGYSQDTASIFLANSPWIPDGDSRTAHRTSTIEAYRQYHGILVHHPLEAPTQDFEAAIECVYHLISVVDAYNSLKILACPVENYIVRHYKVHIQEPGKEYEKLLYIELNIESKWLFREVLRRMISDSYDH